MTCHDSYDQFSDGAARPRIVVGIDGSEAALAALRWAHHQARITGALLELVHVYTSATPYAFSGGGLPALYPVDPARVQRSAEALLQSAVDATGVSGCDMRLTVLDDPSATRALGRASIGASMLVLGAHRHHGLGVLLGSTATACVRNAMCPVVVVPATVAAPAAVAAPTSAATRVSSAEPLVTSAAD